MSSVKGDGIKCPRGHIVAIKGRKPSNQRCRQCAQEDEVRRRKQKKRERITYLGERKALPGLRDTRERLGLTKRELARKAGISPATIHRTEFATTKAGLATRRKLEAAIKELGGNPTRIYGELEVLKRQCEQGHKWESATLIDCPTCARIKGEIVAPNSLSPEELRKLMREKAPDTDRFDYALTSGGRDRRTGWLMEEDLFEEVGEW